MINWLFHQQQSHQIYPYHHYLQYTLLQPNTQQIKKYKLKYQPEKVYHQYHSYSKIKFKSKNYQEILQALNNKSIKYQDTQFSTDPNGLTSYTDVLWKRITEVVPNAVFIAGHSFTTLQNIKCNNQPLQNAIAIIARVQPKICAQILSRVLIDEGIYQFRLMRNGIIENVIIDDYVPTYKGMPLFVGPVFENQVFLMLIEKALAKSFGSYDKMPNCPQEIIDMLLCSTHRRINLLEVKVRQVLQQSLDNKCLVLLQSKSDVRVRNYGINQNQLYHVINHHIIPKQKEVHAYEIISPNKMSAWNGRYSLNDDSWINVPKSTTNYLFKQLMSNRSFLICEEDIPRIFDEILMFENVGSRNKDWVESISKNNVPSFVTFQINSPTRLFMRVNTKEDVNHFIMLALVVQQNKYKYILGNNATLSTKCEILTQINPGRYILCVLHDWEIKNSGEYSVFLSSNAHTNLDRVAQSKYPKFLESVLLEHSVSLKKQQQNEYHSQNKIYSIFIMKECGFAAVVIHTSQIQKEVVKLIIDEKKINNEKWEILQPYTNRKQISIMKNQNNGNIVIILRTNKAQTQHKIYFPSIAFKIKQ